jgi:putative DNA methylase
MVRTKKSDNLRMLKRLIEVALPLKEVSEQSAREKSIRHGHISTLHIWWARRPLAACRAVVFASLIPDPDDPECPRSFREAVMDLLKHERFQPSGEANGKPVEDTPRNRCLEFIKHLVRWENSNNPEFIVPARKLISAAHKFLHPGVDGESPKVLDPFAGGGAIPLEALRLGCEAYAVDLNPVAHLIELCTLVYPQKYGQADSRPVPDYIKRLVAVNRARNMRKDGATLFDKAGDWAKAEVDEIIPDAEITEAEYRKNPLASDVKYWGHWISAKVSQEIGQLYPVDCDGSIPVAYLWARTVKCPNPQCNATIPLIRQLWLCKKSTRKIAVRIVLNKSTHDCNFEVVQGRDIDFDPNNGTMKRGKAACPFCEMILDGRTLRSESKANRMGQQLMAVVTCLPRHKGKQYRTGSSADEAVYRLASEVLAKAKQEFGAAIVPNEQMTSDRPSPNSRGLSGVVRYGMDNFGLLFNDRQSVALTTLVRSARAATDAVRSNPTSDYATAVGAFLATSVDWFADKCTKLTRWHNSGEKISGTFSRQALPMVWDYAEVNPFSGIGADFASGLTWGIRVLDRLAFNQNSATVIRSSATATPFNSDELAAIVTDPPYYDAVPYSDLSDFFYVWLKRTLGDVFVNEFRTPLTPKNQELIAYYGQGKRKVQKPPEWYEAGMRDAFAEMQRILSENGVVCVMFAHKTTSAWESIIAGLLTSGFIVTGSWPLKTEMKTRMVARGAAALASSVTLVCRKRLSTAGIGLWDDVRKDLQRVATERLGFFWSQGIRGADFFISAIGPALSVFGQYERVTKLSGEDVTVGQFLDEVRALVTNYALARILKTTHTGNIDPESRFYVLWKWSYGDAKVPADESFKLAQALGTVTETMWDRTGILEKSGEKVQAVPVAKRMKVKDLGEPNTDSSPASLIDVLHRMCAFREKGDSNGMAEFLARSGQGKNTTLWLVAQAVSEILPDGEKEKQLMQGLLNQRDKLDQEQGMLF